MSIPPCSAIYGTLLQILRATVMNSLQMKEVIGQKSRVSVANNQLLRADKSLEGADKCLEGAVVEGSKVVGEYIEADYMGPAARDSLP